MNQRQHVQERLVKLATRGQLAQGGSPPKSPRVVLWRLNGEGELSFEAGKRLLGQVLVFGKPAPLVMLLGDRADLLKLLAHGSHLGLTMGVWSEPCEDERLRLLRRAGARLLGLNLDLLEPEVLETCRQARAAGLKLQVGTSVSRANLARLGEMLERLVELRVLTWSLTFPASPGLRGGITPRELEAVLHFLAEASRLVSVQTNLGHHYQRVLLERTACEASGRRLELHPLYAELRRHLPARSGRFPRHHNPLHGSVYVSPNGDVFARGAACAGNLRDHSLCTLYREAVAQPVASLPEGRCRECEFRSLCPPGDPWCTYQPGTFPVPELL